MSQNSWVKNPQKTKTIQRNNVAKNNPRQIWVTAQELDFEEGTYENPFGSVSKAFEMAQPGQTIILKAGAYTDDVTFQKSGTIDKPIRIIAEEGAEVEFLASCWFFYDVSDIICSGIVFKDSPSMAVSVIGKCMRNRFEFLRFVNCSMGKENACTLYFGGSGQACNTVESCTFERTAETVPRPGSPGSASIGLMIAEGDYEVGNPNRDYIISNNVFSRYGYGVIIGSQDSIVGEYGHRIEHNIINNCEYEGILVKCGDTLVKGNVIRNCARHSISIAAGTGSIVEDNRIIDCVSAISVAGKGHSIANNCIVRCKEDTISLLSPTSPDMPGASNILIEQNTLIGWEKSGESSGCFVRINPDTTCVVRKNLFFGTGKPYCMEGQGKRTGTSPGDKNVLVTDNISSGGCENLKGCARTEVAFKSVVFDNYANDTGYGACGWMLSPEAYDPGPETFCEPRTGDLILPVEDEPIETDEDVEIADLPQNNADDNDQYNCEETGDSHDFISQSLFFEMDDLTSGLSMGEDENALDGPDEQET
jgi:hypothetical protein